MDVERAQHVEKLFEQALDRPPGERASFLAEACGDDADERAEIESLLAHQEKTPNDFMKPPDPSDLPLPSGAAETPDRLLGRTIGRYRVKAVIGRGGMGTVYEAVQEQPHRTVALKVMRHCVAAQSTLRRFRFEAEILGHLRHPNIAQVYEAGIDDDGAGPVPFFAMEYIPQARPLTDYADQEQLSIRQRVSLFAKMCEAVHHGHQKGVIHRDLKPGNILVDSSGEPKIIDFGVARSTGSDIAITTMQTDVGQLLGTLQYMSPEQCDAEPNAIDTRSDVYSLGVVLYELLVGELPYDVTGCSVYQAARRIKESQPEVPATLDRRLRGDLQIILLKALEKDRECRYQSVADLARDIRHYLDREPIDARPPTLATRARRWLVRHPVVATAAVCLLVAVSFLAGTVLTVWLFDQRPYRLVENSIRREVRLIAYNEKTLKAWSTPSPGMITAVTEDLVSRPGQHGGGRIALVSFHNAWNHEPHGRSLCGFDVDGSLEDPVFELRIESDTSLPDPPQREYTAGDFCVQKAGVLEVLDDNPGPEILVVHGHDTYSQCFIRLYDLGGNVLYQVWHDGTVRDFCWLPKPRLLVFLANNSEVLPQERGIRGLESQDLMVVFAVRPMMEVHEAFLRTDGSGEAPAPVWYRQVKPDNAIDLMRDWFIDPSGPYKGERGAAFTIGVCSDDSSSICVGWDVGETGKDIPRSRVPSAEYEAFREQRGLPDPDAFKLGDLPPVITYPQGPEGGHPAGGAGISGSLAPDECGFFDYDGDGDVDVGDLAVSRRVFTGGP